MGADQCGKPWAYSAKSKPSDAVAQMAVLDDVYVRTADPIGALSLLFYLVFRIEGLRVFCCLQDIKMKERARELDAMMSKDAVDGLLSPESGVGWRR